MAFVTAFNAEVLVFHLSAIISKPSNNDFGVALSYRNESLSLFRALVTALNAELTGWWSLCLQMISIVSKPTFKIEDSGQNCGRLISSSGCKELID